MSITSTNFGVTKTGEEAYLYRLENKSGAYVEITNFGARVVSIVVPDKKGEMRDVALGFSNLKDYEEDDAYLGSICGRYANRICKGKFTLNGKEYSLAINNGPNALHGGVVGYALRTWKAEPVSDENKLVLTIDSPDGEEGYPGNLTLQVVYKWSEDNELTIQYEAVSDADTILNVTNHTYFNLNGHASGTVLDHSLRVDADQATAIDNTLIPTGEIVSVKGTALDFTEFKTIGKDIDAEEEQMKMTQNTYDHNLVLNGSGLREAAVLLSKESGIRMTTFTDQPGLQVYVVDYVIRHTGKHGQDYVPHASVCLETQHFPDSINHENFPSVVCKAGEKFQSTTIYNFSVLS